MKFKYLIAVAYTSAHAHPSHTAGILHQYEHIALAGAAVAAVVAVFSIGKSRYRK